MENEVNERINELRARIANNEASIQELQNANREPGISSEEIIENNAQINMMESDMEAWRNELNDIRNGVFVKEEEVEVEVLDEVGRVIEEPNASITQMYIQREIERLARERGRNPEDYTTGPVTPGDDTQRDGYGDDNPLNYIGIFEKNKEMQKVKRTYRQIEKEVEVEVEEEVDRVIEEANSSITQMYIQKAIEKAAKERGLKPEDFTTGPVTPGDDTQRDGYGDDNPLNYIGIFVKTKKLEKVKEWVDERDLNNKKDDKKNENPDKSDDKKDKNDKDDKDDKKDKTDDSDKMQKMKEEYDQLNDMYLDVLEELESKRNQLNNGEIPYEEYQKYALDAIDKYNYLKDLYEKIENGIAGKDSVKEPWIQGDEKDKSEDKKEDKTDDITRGMPTPEEKDKDSLRIQYEAGSGLYMYEGISNGKTVEGVFKAERNFFKKSKNKAALIALYGEQGFEELFSGATAKAYKKCDVNVVRIIRETLGVNACRDYLLELTRGKAAKKDNLIAKITYNLENLKVGETIRTSKGKDVKLSMFDRFRISRTAKRNKNVATIIPAKSRKALLEGYERRALNEGNEIEQSGVALNSAEQANYVTNLENTKTEFMDSIQVDLPKESIQTVSTDKVNAPQDPSKKKSPTMPDLNEDLDK